jgi:peptide/nickel transport system permease protein
MFRFLLVRIASAIPVLFVLSVVTFAIIQAPPGDYSDYIRSQMINQGGASFEEADAQAQAYRIANGLDAIRQLGHGHRHARRFRP